MSLPFSAKLFNKLDYTDFGVNFDFYTNNDVSSINVEYLCASILLDSKFDIDKLIDQLVSPRIILAVLEKKRNDFTIKQKLKLLNKLFTSSYINSSSIFLAITTFSKKELESLVKIPTNCNINQYIKERPYQYLSTLLICYLYLYQSKGSLNEEQEQLVYKLLTFIKSNNRCLPLITTEQFLSNFSNKMQEYFFLEGFSNIDKRLFIYIDEIPKELYNSSLKYLSKDFPIDIPLYAKCFHKDFDLFIQYINMHDFFDNVHQDDSNDSVNDILTINEYSKCLKQFSKKNDFFDNLHNFIKYENNTERKSILESYLLMDELAESR